MEPRNPFASLRSKPKKYLQSIISKNSTKNALPAPQQSNPTTLPTPHSPSSSSTPSPSPLPPTLPPKDLRPSYDPPLEPPETVVTPLLGDAASFSGVSNTHLPSPISSLPHEIIVLIFSQFQDAIRYASIPTSHVCRLWRNIIVNLPEIWTYIYIDYPSNTQLINTLIHRSKDLLLNVHLEGRQSRPAYELILPYYERIKTLTLHGYPQFLGPFLHLLQRRPLPALVDAKICILTDQNEGSFSTSETPLLKYLEIGGPVLSWFKPALHNLIFLRLNFPLRRGEHLLHAYLNTAILLREMDLMYVADISFASIPSLSLPQLNALRIRPAFGQRGELPFRLLAIISAPQLETVTMEDVFNNAKAWDSSVTHLLSTRWQLPVLESVKTLEIVTDVALGPDVWDITSWMLPSIEHLLVASRREFQSNLFRESGPYYKESLATLAINCLDPRMVKMILSDIRKRQGKLEALFLPLNMFSDRQISEARFTLESVIRVDVRRPRWMLNYRSWILW